MGRCGIVAILTFAAVATCNLAGPPPAVGQEADSTMVPFGHPRPGSYDDGWRRTAAGWENIADWQVVAAADAVTEAERMQWRVETEAFAEDLALVPGWRLDFHPAALALLQLAVLAWLAGFSAPVASTESA